MDDDDNGLCCFGTPLEPIEEGVVAAKRITLADQIAVDSNGRRRFHGAFTGGFSAGFWNTVGSREGWTPSEFKSSRNEKASHRTQSASDFMDEEDIGEYGIAPQRIQTTDDFTEFDKRSTQKRKAENSSGPIPGAPVLELVLESCRDKAAIRLLKRMDSKYAKKLIKLRTETAAQNVTEAKDDELNKMMNIEGNEICDDDAGKNEPLPKVYKCDLGPIQRVNRCDPNSDSDSDIEMDQFLSDSGEFANVLENTKTNRFGLDYSGLYKGNFFTIMGAEAPQRASGSNALSKFTITDKNNKKVTINGQAFGVGAFEEDDDDIYDKDDMSKYDFRLENKSESNKTKQILPNANHFIDGFNIVTNKSIMNNMKRVYKVQLPFKYEPRNWFVRKTRFGPEVRVVEKAVVGRHDLAPSDRGKILNESIPSKSTKEQLLGLSIDEKLKEARLKVVEFATSSKTILFDGEEIEKEAIAAKPFSQTKIESFKVPESLPTICDRFTSASDANESNTLLLAEKIVEKPKPMKEIQKVIRTKSKWLPSQLLCYKMNIESAVGTKPDKPNAFSLFECINVTGEMMRKKELQFTGALHRAEKQSEFKANNVPKVPIIDSIDSKERPILDDSGPANVKTSDKEVNANKVQETMKPPQAIIRKPMKPKTELEQKILETQDEHPSNKKDIFKAIFDSDSDSDNDSGNDNEENTESENKTESILQFKTQSSTMVAAAVYPVYSSIPDNAFMPKSAKEMNVLRNTSPPRGIFKSLAEMMPSEKLNVTTNTHIDIPCESNPIPNLYGPCLPPKDARAEIVSAINKTNHVIKSSSESSDEWIERSSSKKKKKSSKKHKSEKHKKKKSKKSKRRHS